MPAPDIGPRRSSEMRLRRALDVTLARLARQRRRPGRPRGEAGEAVLIDPNRPLELSGGAAAALIYDD